MADRIFPKLTLAGLVCLGLLLSPARVILARDLVAAIASNRQPEPGAPANIEDDDEDYGSSVGDDATWFFAADAILLDRRNPAGNVLFANTVDPTQNLNAANFKFDFQGGFDLSARRRWGDNWLEIRYFGIDQWNATTSPATTPGDLLQINAAVPVFTFSGDRIFASYAAELHNVEANIRRPIGDRFGLLLGLRYLELDERLDATLVNPAVPFTLNTSTRNRLLGAQVGGQVEFWNWEGRLSIVGDGKAGIYGNSAAQGSQFSTGLVTLPASGVGNRTAFVGELGLTFVLALTDRLSLRGGYRLLWLEGVAIASDQLAASDFAAATGFNGTGDAFFHGANGGLQYVW